MWRRCQVLASWRSFAVFDRSDAVLNRSLALLSSCSVSTAPFLKSHAFFSRQAPADGAAETTVKVEDIVPIATGHEREELEAALQGKKRFDLDAPSGPFGTKEAPAVIKSHFDARIVGCPGAEGEDEHDVVWFWLRKGKPKECPVCSQYFTLEVIGDGGLPPEYAGEDDGSQQ